MLALAVGASPALAFRAELRRYPYLTDVVGTNASVNWATDRSGTTGGVSWGPAGGSCAERSAAASRTAITVKGVSEYQWKARLAVAPDTAYCYRVFLDGLDLLGADRSPTFRSQLAPGSTAPFSFAVLGDSGSLSSDGTNPDQANVMARLAASGVRFALGPGDVVHVGESGTHSDYGDLVQPGSAWFARPFWKPVGASLPFFPALGNHGLTDDFLAIWPQDEAVSSSGGRYRMDTYCCLNGTTSKRYPSAWYAFDAGIARFYVLQTAWPNSNLGEGSLYENDYDYHWTPASPEYRWLEGDLATHPSRLKFAFFHFPLYSDNARERSDTFLQGAGSLEGLLSRHGVDIAFNGHAHIYQRNRRPHAGSLVSYVTGGGGARLQLPTTCSEIDAYAIGWSYASDAGRACGAAPRPTSPAQVFHFLEVTVSDTDVTVTPINSRGQVFDAVTYSLTAAGDGPAAVSDSVLGEGIPLGQPSASTPGRGRCSVRRVHAIRRVLRRRGIRLRCRAPLSGRVRAVVRARARVIATGSRPVLSGRTVRIFARTTRTGRRALRRTRSARAVVRVAVPGASVFTRRILLRR